MKNIIVFGIGDEGCQRPNTTPAAVVFRLPKPVRPGASDRSCKRLPGRNVHAAGSSGAYPEMVRVHSLWAVDDRPS